MAILNFTHPLKWPSGKPELARAAKRTDHGFSSALTIDEAVKFLQEEVEGIEGAKFTLFTDYETIESPRSRRKLSQRVGAVLEVRVGNTYFPLSCDRWMNIEQNLYSLSLTLRAIKNIEKWMGVSMPQLLAAFGQPATVVREEKEHPEWMQLLGLGPTATVEDAVAVYHRRARQIGNDDNDALVKLNAAMEQARKHLQ